MTDAYKKPYVTIDKQIEMLQCRGMTISDVNIARDFLNRVDYYRLSQYWYNFRIRNSTSKELKDKFHPNTKFETIIDIYNFDSKLRLIFMDAIATIEIALRSQVIKILGSKDRLEHINILPNISHQELLNKINDEEKYSKDDFIKNYKKKYSLPLPIWISAQLWNFSTLSKLLSCLEEKYIEKLSAYFNITSDSKVVGRSPKHLPSWIHTISDIRNICAHHSRLWDRSLYNSPKKIMMIGSLKHTYHISSENSKKIYFAAAIIEFLLSSIDPKNCWGQQFKTHILTFPQNDIVTIEQAGFPDGWEQESLWVTAA